MLEKQNQPDPEAQYLRDLANAKAVIDEVSQPVYDDQTARMAPSLIHEAQTLADTAGEGENIGDEAEKYLNDGGVAKELGEKATEFLRRETVQPLSGDEITEEATRYLRLYDRMTDSKYAAPSRDESFVDLVKDQTYAMEEIHNQMKSGRANMGFRGMRKEFKPEDDQTDEDNE